MDPTEGDRSHAKAAEAEAKPAPSGKIDKPKAKAEAATSAQSSKPTTSSSGKSKQSEKFVPTIAKSEDPKPSKPPAQVPPEMLAMIGQELTGTVKWYNVQKGYGWIVPDQDVGGDIFLHHSHLVMEGFRSVAEGEKVKFLVERGSRPGVEARNVRGVHGALVGHPERPLPRRYKESHIRCYKCGRAGSHLAKDCKVVSDNANVCYLCKQPGHIRKECPEKRNYDKSSQESTEERKRFRDAESGDGDDDQGAAV